MLVPLQGAAALCCFRVLLLKWCVALELACVPLQGAAAGCCCKVVGGLVGPVATKKCLSLWLSGVYAGVISQRRCDTEVCYTGVIAKEFLHRSCYTGAVTQELLYRSQFHRS